MGYRSEVVGMLSIDNPADTAKFHEMIGMIKLVGSELLDCLEEHEYGWANGRFVFHCDDIKWYDSYPPVQAWDRIFDLPNQIEGISAIFVRLGEEDEDIEYKITGEDPEYDSVCVVRSIDFPSNLLGEKQTQTGEQS